MTEAPRDADAAFLGFCRKALERRGALKVRISGFLRAHLLGPSEPSTWAPRWGTKKPVARSDPSELDLGTSFNAAVELSEAKHENPFRERLPVSIRHVGTGPLLIVAI
jgi:hypothetical protein